VWKSPTVTLNLGTYLPSGSNAYNCTITATDDTQFGANFAINLKQSGAMGNSLFTPLAISNTGVTT
jgi:hypothetical protein